jgi:hypothetical protein
MVMVVRWSAMDVERGEPWSSGFGVAIGNNLIIRSWGDRRGLTFDTAVWQH